MNEKQGRTMRFGEMYEIGYQTANLEQYSAIVQVETYEQAETIGQWIAETLTGVEVTGIWECDGEAAQRDKQQRETIAKLKRENDRLSRAVEMATEIMATANEFSRKYAAKYEPPRDPKGE